MLGLAMIVIELSAITVLRVTYVVPIVILAVSAFFLAVYELLAFSAWRSSMSEHVGRHWLFEVSDSGIFAKWPRGGVRCRCESDADTAVARDGEK
ncbi:MAG TPA: hypothetical protein VH141_31895 [Pseudonocardia sp.]|nr:hypothetical protein [Pseudonocardia sp.]